VKQLLSLDGGAVTLSEQGGSFVLSFDKSLSIGGGAAAGILSIDGKGSIVLSGLQAVKLLEAVINSHVPAVILPAVEAGEKLANDAIAGA